MILSLLLALAGAGEHEENTFALVFQGLEWATPDLRVEVGEGPVRPVLSWPVTPVSVGWCMHARCGLMGLAEPYVEPQLRLGAKQSRVLVGSQLLLVRSRRGLGIGFDGAAVTTGGGWGWVSGGSLLWGGGGDRNVRGRFALRARYYRVEDTGWADLSVDVAAPIAVLGWARLFQGDSVDSRNRRSPEPPPRPDRIDDGFDPYDPYWEPDRPPACDPIGCMPGMCGVVGNGCGGTMSCGPCEEELLLPGCDPIPACAPGVCGPQPDGCGGTEFCGPCFDEDPLGTCDPEDPCLPGVCGVFPDGCGGTVSCGACDALPLCQPLVCDPTMCGPVPDGCGGTVDCGSCEAPSCDPVGCQPGTCGAQPDGCGGTLDCGPCTP